MKSNPLLMFATRVVTSNVLSAIEMQVRTEVELVISAVSHRKALLSTYPIRGRERLEGYLETLLSTPKTDGAGRSVQEGLRRQINFFLLERT